MGVVASALPGRPSPPGRPGRRSHYFVAQVDCSLALDGLDTTQVHLTSVEQPNAPAHQLRHDMQHDLVHQPVGQRLLGGEVMPTVALGAGKAASARRYGICLMRQQRTYGESGT